LIRERVKASTPGETTGAQPTLSACAVSTAARLAAMSPEIDPPREMWV
jgi:hypothetical protein